MGTEDTSYGAGRGQGKSDVSLTGSGVVIETSSFHKQGFSKKCKKTYDMDEEIECNFGALSKLASILGIPIMADKNTVEKNMVHYARVLIEMPIMEKLSKRIHFEDERVQSECAAKCSQYHAATRQHARLMWKKAKNATRQKMLNLCIAGVTACGRREMPFDFNTKKGKSTKSQQAACKQ
ncbi:hypothetical protein Cgig2_009915 [Carnegiea gigantea]|uniref:Uncharacterized protein n=1 Tax=Carnegiea gigantea TaxID=171969 RepID=A0A9Q1QD41_9CARY|nr:hypothetical protein Cgig2_009915 [Carnegiea gigantea]